VRRTALTICPNEATREAIQKALRERLDVEPVGEAASPAEALALAADLRPNLAVVAQRPGRTDEVLALRALRVAAPDARLVVLTWYAAALDWLAALLSGASACILVQVRMIDSLAETIERVEAGENLIVLERGEDMARLTGPYTAGLSLLSQEVISRVFRLETDAQIAASMGIAPASVTEQVEAMARRFLPA
jgi:DNA-binding NarL/FixJ family response regulator